MDLHRVAELVKTPAAPVRLRQGLVTAVAADGTITVQIASSTNAIAGVLVLGSCCPVPGEAVWLATDGIDIWAIGTLAPTAAAFCSVRRVTNQSVGDGASVYINFGAAPALVDTTDMWDAASPSQLTVKVPGVYSLTFAVSWGTSSTGRRTCLIEVDGTAVAADRRMGISAGNTSQSAHVELELAIGAVIKAQVVQASGGALNALALASSPLLTATWLRPPT